MKILLSLLLLVASITPTMARDRFDHGDHEWRQNRGWHEDHDWHGGRWVGGALVGALVGGLIVNSVNHHSYYQPYQPQYRAPYYTPQYYELIPVYCEDAYGYQYRCGERRIPVER